MPRPATFPHTIPMKLVCLDLEGVLTPEIWPAFASAAGIPELQRTTRDEPDYDKLMAFRVGILSRHQLKLPDIQRVITSLEPLPGALDFLDTLREKTQIIILSDTFEQFALPLMRKLRFPTLFCNSLFCAADGAIQNWRLRQEHGKKEAVRALKSCNIEVFAAGDSYNDIAMIEEAGRGCLFCPPPAIQAAYTHIPAAFSYAELDAAIRAFLDGGA